MQLLRAIAQGRKHRHPHSKALCPTRQVSDFLAEKNVQYSLPTFRRPRAIDDDDNDRRTTLQRSLPVNAALPRVAP